MTRPAAETAGALRPAANRAEADLLIAHLGDVMEALLGVVEEETEMVREGRLADASALEATKAELSRLYAVDAARLKSSQEFLLKAMPEQLAAIRKRHDTFHALLQMNLTVLATAHAVAESIMRGVSDELARKSIPQGYGASGRGTPASVAGAQPLAVSRVL